MAASVPVERMVSWVPGDQENHGYTEKGEHLVWDRHGCCIFSVLLPVGTGKVGGRLSPAEQLQRQHEAHQEPDSQHTQLRSHLRQAGALQHVGAQRVDHRGQGKRPDHRL